MREITIGYVPLTDAAVLIAAAELGFAAQRGLAIRLEREASWATLRDKLALGVVDAAHMLAPLAIATALGLPPIPAQPLVAPFVLNLNGNAVTLSTGLWQEVVDSGPVADVRDVAASLGTAIRRRTARGLPPPTFATTFPYSTHTYQLRFLFAWAGLDPERDVSLTVVPPPHMVEALRSGAVDGFCVGSPWNSVAVEAGCGRIAALGTEVVPDAPEKVLAWPAGRLGADFSAPLLGALQEAADWCADPANRRDLAALLANERILGIDAALIERALAGRLDLASGGPARVEPAHLRFGGVIHRPDPRHAMWIYDRMVEAGQVEAGPNTQTRAVEVYDPAAYDAAVAPRI